MKEIKINKIQIDNFKGVRTFVLGLDGDSISIYGRNKSGKSTIADAFFWCLFGKNSNGETNFAIKPIDAEGNEYHYLTTKVTVELIVDGVIRTLERSLKEIWTKTRGNLDQDAVFTGHETLCKYDGVNLKVTEFQKKVNELLNENLFKAMSNTMYFSSLDWKSQRDVIYSLVNGITEEEVINANEELIPLNKFVANGKKVSDLQKQKRDEKLLLLKEIDALPVQIKTLSEIKYDIPDDYMDEDALKLIEVKRQNVYELQKAQNLNQSANSVTKIKEDEIYKIEAEIKSYEREIDELRQSAISNKKYELLNIKSRIVSLQSTKKHQEDELKALTKRIESGNLEIAKLEEKRVELLNKCNEISKRAFDEKLAICDKCGQAIPQDMLEKVKYNFNIKKSQDLEDTISLGKKTKETLQTYQVALEKLINNKIQVDEDIKNNEIEIQETALKINELETKEVSVNTETLDVKIRVAKIKLDKVRDELKISEDGQAEDRYSNEINALTEDITKLISMHSKYELKLGNEISINEYQSKLKEKQKAYEEAEKIFILCDKFNRIMADYMESKVNSQFEYVKFKLFEEQINGGIKETCVITVNGVPFSSVNTGSKIQAGLDIIKKLQEIYDVKVPVFIDNAEAVTDWDVKVDSQIIKLIASDSELDKTLRYEI